MEKAMATHSSTLAWKIPWTEGPGRLQSMGSLGVGHNWVTSLSLFTFMHWRKKWQPTPVFLSGEFQGRRAWWAAVYGVAQSRIWLKRLSSSSSSKVTKSIYEVGAIIILILKIKKYKLSEISCAKEITHFFIYKERIYVKKRIYIKKLYI